MQHIASLHCFWVKSSHDHTNWRLALPNEIQYICIETGSLTELYLHFIIVVQSHQTPRTSHSANNGRRVYYLQYRQCVITNWYFSRSSNKVKISDIIKHNSKTKMDECLTVRTIQICSYHYVRSYCIIHSLEQCTVLLVASRSSRLYFFHTWLDWFW